MSISELISAFAEHPVLLFFLASLIGGEESIIPLAILVGHGFSDYKTIFVVSFFGTLFADALWFLLGRHGIHRRKFFLRYESRYKRVSAFVRKLAKTDWGLLLITKFIYGTRIFTIIYLSTEGLSVLKFLKINSFVILIWLFCIVTGGWMIGKGSAFFTNLFAHPWFLVIGILAFVFIFRVVRNRFAKKILPVELKE